MKAINPLTNEDPLELLRRCGGYYQCPKDPSGKRLGPLVGYAGRDIQKRQYVGDVYVNFAKAERHGSVLTHVAVELKAKLALSGTGFCGAPEGGKALANMLASLTNRQYIFPEKKVTVLGTPTAREESILVFDRHEPEAGEEWWITEDVCNNFSTTDKMAELIQTFGASVMGVVCFLNRSLEVDSEYRLKSGLVLPVISLVRKRIEQYKQDDPAVVEDIQANNVTWKPKNKDQWSKLEVAMMQS